MGSSTRSSKVVVAGGIALACGVAAIALFVSRRAADTTAPLAPRGGEAFTEELVIEVARFAQADARWADDKLGDTDGRLRRYGCTISSVAMGLAAFGVDVTPGELNARLAAIDGYDARGRLRWAAVGELFAGVHVDWRRPPSHATLDAALRAGEPIVVRITLWSGNTGSPSAGIDGQPGFARPSAGIEGSLSEARPSIGIEGSLSEARPSAGIEHWVVVVGKRGLDYLVRDPLAPEALRTLGEYDSDILALRVIMADSTDARGR